jgi:drug/metabolite transporter (DMT)-like permease
LFSRLSARDRVRETIGTLAFLRIAIFSATIAILLINLALRTSLQVPDARTWWALPGLGMVSQLGGYLFLTSALGHLPATITSVSLLRQGPPTAVMATVFLGESLTTAQILGGALVLSGVGLAHKQRHPEEEANV